MKHASFIVVLVLSLVLAIALLLGGAIYYVWQSGPPRDPKCFALDSEDFGLGFHIGDPWNPDAFEAAMKQGGLDVIRSPHSADPEYDFCSASWYTTDYMLSVQVMSDNKTADAALRTVNLTPHKRSKKTDIAAYEESPQFIRLQELKNEADERFPNDEDAAREWFMGQHAILAGDSVPQVRTAKGITLGSTEKELKQAYGEPFDWTITEGSHWVDYTANDVSVIFFLWDDQAYMINVGRGYRHMSTNWKFDAWDTWAMTEEDRKARDEYYAELDKKRDDREAKPAGGEEATSEIESEQD